ncbi:MAG: DUF4255 domain-containing protein [Desulfobacterales bacterium]
MALQPSSLSRVCRSIADFLSDGLRAGANSIRVLIGNPADAQPGQADTEHRVNLFFYRIEPSGLFPDRTHGDTAWIRLYCLVTGFGIAEDQISAGENDLRLLGEVMRLIHQNPVMDLLTVDDEAFRLQMIFHPLSPDELNHIWSTQGDVSYRPSVAYELALAPIIPAQRRADSPLVGAVGTEVRAAAAARTAAFGAEILRPPVVASTVDTTDPGWEPRICFVHQGGCFQSLAFETGSQALADFQPRIWIAGDPGSPVVLVWERWSSASRWQRAASLPSAAATRTLDPELAAEAVAQAIDLPFDSQPGQAVLYAERSFVRAQDGRQLTVRSNLLLVTLFAGP